MLMVIIIILLIAFGIFLNVKIKKEAVAEKLHVMDVNCDKVTERQKNEDKKVETKIIYSDSAIINFDEQGNSDPAPQITTIMVLPSLI